MGKSRGALPYSPFCATSGSIIKDSIMAAMKSLQGEGLCPCIGGTIGDANSFDVFLALTTYHRH
jgi:hypothetical protein